MPAAPLSQFSHGEYSTWFRHDRYPGQANHHAGSAGFLNQQPEELNKFNPSVFSLMAHPEQKLYDSDPAEDTSWLLAYADIITDFFVPLFSSSIINKENLTLLHRTSPNP